MVEMTPQPEVISCLRLYAYKGFALCEIAWFTACIYANLTVMLIEGC